MSVHTKVHNNTAVSTSGNSPAFLNQGAKRHVLTVVLPAAPTGTTPTITYAIQTSNDQITWTQKGAALAALSALGQQRTNYGPGTVQGAIIEKYIRVAWVVTGTTPNFPNVSAAFSAVDC